MTPTEYGDLIERLKAARVGGRELSEAVLDATNPYRDGPYANYRVAAVAFDWDLPVTTSVDAALALVERCLPERFVGLDQGPDGWEACLSTNHGMFLIQGDLETYGRSSTAALALCIALVTALNASTASAAADQEKANP